MELRIAIDLAKNSKGSFARTFSNLTQDEKGLPLSTVAVEGRSVRFVLKVGKDVSTFVGLLSDDGKSIAGRAGVRSLLGRMLQWRMVLRWYVFAIKTGPGERACRSRPTREPGTLLPANQEWEPERSLTRGIRRFSAYLGHTLCLIRYAAYA